MELVDGRYRLEAELGKGGMGAVYLAVDLRSGQEVALKRMSLRSKKERSERALLKFQREFHTLASLRHPRIVRVFDYGVTPKGPYYTMELLGGEDLLRRIKTRGPIDAREACRLLRDMASALAALHARGLIHRDLSPRNVRVVDGRALLFDFGVLVNVGWTGEVAGTPSTMAPETLRGWPLDGRADLYSLGVIAYRMVTGRKPYEARSTSELAACWARPLTPPSTLAPVPEGLEDLILDLLCLEPLGRPPSAAVLVDRLTAIGGLAPDPELAASPGFVESAAMVGRDEEVALVSGLLEETLRGGPRAFVVEADSGAGKTRLLQEVAIRAKLEGALALRVSCEEADGGPFATLAALLDAAFTAAPADAARATRQEAPLLARVFESVRRVHASQGIEREAGEPAEDRMRLQAAAVRALAALAEGRPVAILVDDLQRCDEASAAALAGLARGGFRGVLVGVSRRLGDAVRAPTAVASISALEPRLRLGGLDESGVEALLRSLFGDATHLRRLARWLHRTTGGSPLFCTALTRHLVESGAIRADGGGWVLPERAPEVAMPAGLAEAMRGRVAALSGRARAIAEALALRGGESDLELAVALAHLPGLELPEDRGGAVFAALFELVRQGVVVDTGERLRFRHDSIREALLAGVEPARRAALHRHVGETLLAGGARGDPAAEAEAGWHLCRGGDEGRGAPMLERAGRRLFEAQALADCIAPLSTALEVRERRGAPAAVLADLSYRLLAAGWVADRETGSRHAERALDLYADLSGLATAGRLGRSLGFGLALALALGSATLRWLLRRGEARGPSPIRCLSLFALGLTYATAIAYAANQKERVRSLVARVEPFRAFEGHAPFAAYLAVNAMQEILEGRLEPAVTKLTEAQRLSTSPRGNPLRPEERLLADAACRAMRLLVDVNQFDPRLHEDLAAIDASGLAYYRHVADSIRAVYHRYRGEEARARALEASLEAEALQLGAWSTELQRLLFAHPAFALAHDVEGLKRSLDALEARIAEGMELEVRAAIARAEIHRELGEGASALAILEPLLEGLEPGDHLSRQWGASAAAQAALEAGLYDRAEAHALVGLDDGEDQAVRLLLPWLRCQRALGLAEDGLGRPEEGAARIERAIAVAEDRDCPILAGELHEARARIALGAGDRLRFEVHRGRCGEWLRPTENPGLVAVVERLYELDRGATPLPVDARRRRPSVSGTVTAEPSRSSPDATTVVEDGGSRSRSGSGGAQ